MKRITKNKIQEGCECEKKALVKKIKRKYMKEHAFSGVSHFSPEIVKEWTSISECDLTSFLNKDVLLETTKGSLKGVLGIFKNNYVIFENSQNKRLVDPDQVTKFVCENVKYTFKPKQELNEKLTELDTNKQVIANESFELLTKEQLKYSFFVKEEIVNADNKGKLTADRQASRDKIEKKLKNVKVVKGPKGRMDTPQEARYRLATFIELQKNKKKD